MLDDPLSSLPASALIYLAGELKNKTGSIRLILRWILAHPDYRIVSKIRQSSFRVPKAIRCNFIRVATSYD
jgi:hypothetical protein